MLQLNKVRDQVYILKFDSQFEMCMAFLRYEEFYESSNPHFQHKPFTLAEYMSWYANEFGEGSFTYTEDWSGFNIPREIITEVHKLGVTDMNHYDHLMLGVAGMTERGSYLIGVSDESDVKDHELTHAMYYIDASYASAINFALTTSPQDLVDSMKLALHNEGYAMSSTTDEIQAYVTTGENKMFDDIEHPYLDALRSRLIAIHKEHFNRFYAQPSASKDQTENTGSTPVHCSQGHESDRV